MVIDRFADNPTRPGRRLIAACTAAAVVAFAGLGNDAPAAGDANPIDACTLLTGQDVAMVLGVPVGEPEARTRGENAFWTSMCNYREDSADGVLGAGILIKPHNGAGPEQGYAAHDAELIEQLGEDAALTPFDHIGDRAGWQMPNRVIGQLTVFQGPYMFIVTVGTAPGADRLTPAAELAKRALLRLPQE
jgi:hypothetical protein